MKLKTILKYIGILLITGIPEVINEFGKEKDFEENFKKNMEKYIKENNINFNGGNNK